MYRAGSPHTPRVIAGHGWRQTSSPSSLRIDLPLASNTSTSIPSEGPPSEQGLIGSTTNGARNAPPTSVPPEKLMIGTRRLPTVSLSHLYGSSFHGSPV